MNYVIIGNSAAAVGAIEGIRQIDKTGKITVISDEPYHTYSRPLISYYVHGKVTPETIHYRDADFYSNNGCEVLLGRRVTAIDPKCKAVTLDGGQQIGYDKLLVATGSRPLTPPIEGLDKVENRFSFLSFDDAKGVENAITPESRVLILGAGLIGLKAAEGIASKVAQITVLDLANRILPSILDEQGSNRVRRHLEKQGIRFVLGDSVTSFMGNSAVLKSGGIIEFDLLITAVGVRPNTGLVQAAGGKVEQGIVTDALCQTSLTDIYAAGDCTQSQDVSSGTQRVLALLPNAYLQGECAGINMAGGHKVYENAIPMNAIGFFGLHIITAGSYEGEAFVEEDENRYKRLFYKDGLLKGYILIGDVARAGIYTSLIRERYPLGDVDWELVKHRPQMLAFGKQRRKEKLGGKKSGD